jgi:hypothetical protein
VGSAGRHGALTIVKVAAKPADPGDSPAISAVFRACQVNSL